VGEEFDKNVARGR